MKEKSYLLIGNSRWHWAFRKSNGLDFIDTSIESESLEFLKSALCAWAAVGKIPSDVNLDPTRKITLTDIPLSNLPPWLGIDRALAAWGAFIKAKQTSSMHKEGLLIADAGTICSLTLVSTSGEFMGGQLIPGIKLQLSAMTQGAQNLKYPSISSIPHKTFPISTSEAMLQGSIKALSGALIEAQKEMNVPIWLCGGDGPLLIKALEKYKIDIKHHPHLVLEGMINVKEFTNPKTNP